MFESLYLSLYSNTPPTYSVPLNSRLLRTLLDRHAASGNVDGIVACFRSYLAIAAHHIDESDASAAATAAHAAHAAHAGARSADLGLNVLRFSGLQAIHRTATRQLELDGNYMACIAVLETLDNGTRAPNRRSPPHGAVSASRWPAPASASSSSSSSSASLSSVAGGTGRASGKAAVGAADGNATSNINADDGDNVNASAQTDADDVDADHDDADTATDLMADGDPLSCNFTATWARHAPHLRRARTSKHSPFHTIHRGGAHNARHQDGSGGNATANGSVGANGRRLTRFEQHHQQVQQQQAEQQTKSPANDASVATQHQQQRSMTCIESADVYVSPAVALNSSRPAAAAHPSSPQSASLPLPLPASASASAASAPVSASVELASLLALPAAAFDAGSGCGREMRGREMRAGIRQHP